MVYRVTEIFKSIEGEGKRVGKPCVFIRLAGCNLRCSYCDTVYSQRSGDGHDMTLEEIVKEVRRLNTSCVTITGGEPMLQDAVSIVKALNWCECNIETNGSIPLPEKPRNAFYTMDWKCRTSGMTDAMVTENLEWLDSDDVLKFVVGAVEDLEQAKSVIESGVKARAYLSPVYGMIEPREIVSYVLDNNLDVTVQVQLHKVIWDPDERGV